MTAFDDGIITYRGSSPPQAPPPNSPGILQPYLSLIYTSVHLYGAIVSSNSGMVDGIGERKKRHWWIVTKNKNYCTPF